MTAAAIKTGNGSVFRLADGNNGLVAIALHSLRAYYALRAQFQSANALERVVHTFEFISQLRLVAHMQKAASPAAAEVGAGRLDHDKRDSIRERDDRREMDRAFKR